MTERDYSRKLAKIFNSIPGCVCRLLPDTGTRGHKKPYDMFVIYKGRHISIEAKMGTEKLAPHQIAALEDDERAGSTVLIARYVFNAVRFCSLNEFPYYLYGWELRNDGLRDFIDGVSE